MKKSVATTLLVALGILLKGTFVFSTEISNSTTNTSVLRQEEEFGGGNEAAANALQGVAVLLSTFFQIVQDLSKLKPFGTGQEMQTNATKTPLVQVEEVPSSPPSTMVMIPSLPKQNEVVNLQLNHKPPPQKIPTTVVTTPTAILASTINPKPTPASKPLNVNPGVFVGDGDDEGNFILPVSWNNNILGI